MSTICIKNFGNSPAKEIRADYIPSSGELVMGKTGSPSGDLVLFPGVSHYFFGALKVTPSLDAMPNEDALRFIVKIRCKGQNDKEYSTRQEYRYIPNVHEFAHVKGEARRSWLKDSLWATAPNTASGRR